MCKMYSVQYVTKETKLTRCLQVSSNIGLKGQVEITHSTKYKVKMCIFIELFKNHFTAHSHSYPS